jgi:hypothetical protein
MSFSSCKHCPGAWHYWNLPHLLWHDYRDVALYLKVSLHSVCPIVPEAERDSQCVSVELLSS